MKQWWIYELRAGEWFYIGMTSNVEHRLSCHQCAIRKHPEKPRNSNWHEALREYPNPESWHIRVLAGPYDNKEEALSEEARLQEKHWARPGRIWERCGNSISDKMKKELSESLSGQNNPNWGKSPSEEATEKNRQSHMGERNGMYGKKHTKASNEKRSQSLKAAWARRKQEEAQKSLD